MVLHIDGSIARRTQYQYIRNVLTDYLYVTCPYISGQTSDPIYKERFDRIFIMPLYFGSDWVRPLRCRETQVWNSSEGVCLYYHPGVIVWHGIAGERWSDESKTYANGNAKSTFSSFQTYCFQITAETFLVPPLWEKKRREEKKNVWYFSSFFPPNDCRRRNLFFFWLQIVNTVIETSSCDDPRSIST